MNASGTYVFSERRNPSHRKNDIRALSCVSQIPSVSIEIRARRQLAAGEAI